jgi:hypothetical protein
MSENFDEQIAAQESTLARLRAEMEILRQEFVGQIAEFLALWYTERAREIVRSAPEKAETLGSESLGELKREVEQLSRSAPELTGKTLSNPEHWWHLQNHAAKSAERQGQYTDVAGSYRFRQRADPPTALLNPLYDLLNELGKVMHKRGFLVDGRGGSYSAVGTSMQWPENAVETMGEYSNKISAALAAEREVRKIQHAKSVHSVGDLWDSL